MFLPLNQTPQLKLQAGRRQQSPTVGRPTARRRNRRKTNLLPYTQRVALVGVYNGTTLTTTIHRIQAGSGQSIPRQPPVSFNACVYLDGYHFGFSHVGSETRVYRSDDDGASWARMTNLPTVVTSFNGGSSTQNQWRLAAGSGTLFVTTGTVTMFSDDYGVRWRTLPNFSSSVTAIGLRRGVLWGHVGGTAGTLFYRRVVDLKAGVQNWLSVTMVHGRYSEQTSSFKTQYQEAPMSGGFDSAFAAADFNANGLAYTGSLSIGAGAVSVARMIRTETHIMTNNGAFGTYGPNVDETAMTYAGLATSRTVPSAIGLNSTSVPSCLVSPNQVLVGHAGSNANNAGIVHLFNPVTLEFEPVLRKSGTDTEMVLWIS